MNADERRLRAALRGAPPAPEAPGFGARLAEQARRRRGLQRTGVATGAAVLCIAVVSGGLALGPDDVAELPTANPTSNQTQTTVEPPAPENLDCSRPPSTNVAGAPVVPEGAVAARLCGGLVDNAGFNQVWPADTLRGTYVERLVARLNRLEPYAQPEGCTLVLSAPFDLVLLYRDGSKVWVNGDTSGSCENVAVLGGEVWAGAPAILRSALAIIARHRTDAGPLATIGPPECPSNWNEVAYTAGAAPVLPGSPVALAACRYLLESPAPGTITQSADGVLEQQATAGVATSTSIVRMVAEGSQSDPCGGVASDLDRTQDVVLVRDSLGDVHVVSTTPCWANDLTGVRRYPSEALVNAVTDLLD